MLAFPAPYYCLTSILITTQSQSDYSHHAATVRQDGRGEKAALLCVHLLYMQIISLHWFAVMSPIVFESGYLSGSAAVTLTLCVCLNRSGPRPTT